MKTYRTVLSSLLWVVLSVLLSATAWAGALHDAIDAGDVAQVKAILAKDPSAATHPAADDDDIMPLAWAAMGGDAAIVDLLLAAGADVDKGGAVSPLGLAVYGGQLAIVKELLDKGASPKAVTAKKVSTLHLAARGAVRTVTKTGEGVESYSFAENTEISALLLKAGVSPSATDANGQTPLHQAAANGNPGIVRQLLEAKVPVDVRTVNGLTPLHYASMQGDRVVAKDGEWQTIKYYSNAEAARLLLAAGADVNAATQDKDKLTPLMMAAARGLDDVVDVLLAAKADVNKKSGDGKTALHFAADSILLIESRVVPGDDEKYEERTVLPIKTIEALLKAGASRTAKDNEGHTPADLARNHEPEIVKMLKVSK